MTIIVESPKPARPHLFPFRALEQLLHTNDSRELARRFNWETLTANTTETETE